MTTRTRISSFRVLGLWNKHLCGVCEEQSLGLVESNDHLLKSVQKSAGGNKNTLQ